MKAFHFPKPALLLLPFVLIACPASDDSSKPSAAITSPASDAALSSTAPIQIDAKDDKGVTQVEVFARARGSKNPGLSVGTAVSSPYVVSWDTSGVPNGELELVAVASDAGGNRGESAPVRVRVQNTNAPSVNYLVAYSLPPRDANVVPKSVGSSTGSSSTGSASASLASAAGDALLPERTRFALENLVPTPSGIAPASLRVKSDLKAQADPIRTLALEWSWQPFNAVGSISGADGYSVWLSKTDAAGPYERVVNKASSTSGTQKYSKDFLDARVGDTVYGAIKAVTNNRTTESGYSNADAATFPRAMEAASPADGATITDGRPTLTWTPMSDDIEYLYLLYDKLPWDASAKLVWGNTPTSTRELSATYPAARDKLAAGTYYWWVVGVKYDALRKADGFSFSEPRKIIVP